MSTNHAADRFTALPNHQTLAVTVVVLEDSAEASGQDRPTHRAMRFVFTLTGNVPRQV